MATATSDLRPAPRPRLPPCSSPPTRVSSTATSHRSGRSRSGRTIAVRKRVASSTPSGRAEAQQALKRLAETPFFAEVMYPRQATANQTVSGVRVRWKIVPVVTDTTPSAAFTPKPPVTHPTSGGSAARANETVWPAQPKSIAHTGVIIGKTTRTTRHSHGVIVTALESRGRKLLHHPCFMLTFRWTPF